MSQVDKYQALKRQMPLLELTDTLSNEMVEPFPEKAGQWLKLSQTVLIVSIALLLAAAGFAGISAKSMAAAKRALSTGEIKTEADLRKAQQTTKALRQIGVPAILEQGNIMTRLAGALHKLPAWHIKFEPQQSISVEFTTEPDRDHLDVLEMIDKALKPLGFKHSATTQAAAHRYTATFTPDE